MENRFDNIRATITNNEEDINLDLIYKSRKKTCKKILGRDDNTEGDLDNDMTGKSIYVFSQMRYTKIKTYKRYIYICQ